MNISNTSKICQWCFKPLIKKHSIKYCNNKCQNNYQYMNNFLNWYYEIKTNYNNNALRKFLETIYGHKCFNCHITEWNKKPIVFDVEHKNGISIDNSPNNIILLCQNCHSQTETYSNSQTGTGRYSLIKKGFRYE